MSDLRKCTKWNGSHRGLSFEISNFNSGDRDHWAFYLFVNIDQLPESAIPFFWLEPQVDNRYSFRIYYNYFDSQLIQNIAWHSGCTFYDKISGIDGTPRVVKIGCDYSHLWDEGNQYDEKYLKYDAIEAIDSFWNLVPNYKVRCWGNGKIYSISEGEFDESGGFKSNEYFKKDKEEQQVRSST